MMKTYKIANLLVAMDVNGRTEKQAAKYQVVGNTADADILIHVNAEETLQRFPDISYDDAIYLSSGKSFHRQLLEFEGMMLHASAVVVDNKAYLFSAPCGTGKSTHTALWCRVFGEEKAQILNDDKPVLRLEEGTWYAYGTPWSGKHDKSVNIRVPLAGICILRRGEENIIAPYEGKNAVIDLLMQTPKPKDMLSRAKILELLNSLIINVPVWKMECTMDPQAAIVSYEAMSGTRFQ